MKILHYILGLPPYRSGGMTRYAIDLMLAQNKNGDIITLLYPGDYTFWCFQRMRIVQNDKFYNITVFEIKNPPLVPLQLGVKNPDDIYSKKKQISEKIIEEFYNKVKPDVIHLHSWMGLPNELLLFFKKKGVKIVFTTHDYFGLCLKTNFINKDNLLCDGPGEMQCAVCNQDAPSSLFLKLRNSKYLLRFKEKLSSYHSPQKKANGNIRKKHYKYESIVKPYHTLLSYYIKNFNYIDYFHFNSTVSKEVYNKYITPKYSKVLNISNAQIEDNRIIREIKRENIRFAFIGNTTMYKGFPLLKNVLCELNNNGISNWSLNVWWGGTIGPDFDCTKIVYRGKYLHEELKYVYNSIDLLIVPSIWKETFSLIALEALSFGVPVLVSNNVGAKDIITDYYPDFVFHPSKESLYIKLETILTNPTILNIYNKIICEKNFEYFLDDHVKKIRNIYNSLLV